MLAILFNVSVLKHKKRGPTHLAGNIYGERVPVRGRGCVNTRRAES